MNMRQVIDRICEMLSSTAGNHAGQADLRDFLTGLPDAQLKKVVALVHVGRDEDREVQVCHTECAQRFPTPEHRVSVLLEMRADLREYLSNGRDLCRAAGFDMDEAWEPQPDNPEPDVYGVRLAQQRTHWTPMSGG